jgi:hypothetical protein
MNNDQTGGSPMTLKALLSSVGKPKTADDFMNARVKAREAQVAAQDELKKLAFRRAERIESLDPAGVEAIDARVETLKKLLPDLQATEGVFARREQELRIEEATKAAPALLRKLAPLVDRVEGLNRELATAQATLQEEATKCLSAWHLAPRDLLPERTDVDDALVDRIAAALVDGGAGTPGTFSVGLAQSRFDLPRRPKPPEQATVVTMARKEDSTTFNVRSARRSGGVG